MAEPTTTLFSSGLLSKWGFNDGDPPPEWDDYLEEQGHDREAFEFPLVALVLTYLIPEVSRHHTVEVCEIDTHHNPIRVERVDGVEIDPTVLNDGIVLHPEWVEVPLSAALTIAVGQA